MYAYILVATLLGAGYTGEYKDLYPNIDGISSNQVEAIGWVGLTNAGLGCLRAGIGQAINKGGIKYFVDGCAKGAISGGIVFFGKWIASNNKTPGLGALGKVTHSIGASMTDNVMLGKDWFHAYGIEIGPASLIFTNGSVIPDIKISVMSSAGLVYALNSGFAFDWRRSLYNLTPIFSSNSLMFQKYDSKTVDGNIVGIDGIAIGQVVIYSKGFGTNRLLSHELVHTLQHQETMACGNILNAWSITKKIEKYFDIGGDMCDGLHSLSSIKKVYDVSPLELEAFSLQTWE